MSSSSAFQCFKFLLIFLLGCSICNAQGSGNTLKFDGVSTRIIHPALFNDLNLPITLSYWLKVDGVPNTVERVFNSCYTPDNFYYGFSSHFITNGVNINYGDGRGPLNPAFRRGKKYQFVGEISDQWIHVAVSVRGATDMNIYINGIEVDGNYSGSGLAMAVNSACETIIGYGTDNNGAQFLSGELDEISVWNYSKSIDEIRVTMCSKLSGNESGLVGYWSFEEGSGMETLEMMSGNRGAIEGNVNWGISGAPIGDESFFEYFPSGTKKKLFKNQADSFWITSESDDWIGYQVYKVNQPPNSVDGTSLNFSNGYYGIFPIFRNNASGFYRVYAGNATCGVLEFRDGNDDLIWDSATERGDSLISYQSNDITELIFEDAIAPDAIDPTYTICSGESVDVNAEDGCVEDYLWSTGEVSPKITISTPGNYWLERKTPFKILRESFIVSVIDLPSDLIAEERVEICQSEFPIELRSEYQDIIWNTGERGGTILVDEVGFFWGEYQSNCGVVRDSVFVEIIQTEPFIPNVLTPNNDGKNDCFVVDGDLSGSSLEIFNRSGVKIYNAKFYNNNWCPDIPAGVYYYRILSSCDLKLYKGWITVLK